jgi:hypothetical protein
MKGVIVVGALVVLGYRIVQFPRIRGEATKNVPVLQQELDRVNRAIPHADPVGRMSPYSNKRALKLYRDEIERELSLQTSYRDGRFVTLLLAGRLRKPECIESEIWVDSDFDADPFIALIDTEGEMKKMRT